MTQKGNPTMIKTAKMTDQRLTVRLTEEDDAALQIVQRSLQPYSFVSRVDLIRAAIHKAAQAVTATGVIG
jgi:hypothetical protein